MDLNSKEYFVDWGMCWQWLHHAGGMSDMAQEILRLMSDLLREDKNHLSQKALETLITGMAKFQKSNIKPIP